VDAGAGTGKTTTLIEILSEIILRELQKSKLNSMERILAISFGVEASRQLKTALKNRLREHEEAGGELPSEVWRQIESESHIQTIDSFVQSLLKEIALKMGISPAFSILTGLELEDLVKEAFSEVLSRHEYAEISTRLIQAFPSLDYLEFRPENLEEMIWGTHQKSREFCMDISQVCEGLLTSVKDLIHQGKCPPFQIADLKEIVYRLTNGDFVLTCSQESENMMVAHAEDVYTNSFQLAKDFGALLAAFDKEYDKLSRERGRLTYVDASYLVWKYTVKQNDMNWIESLRNRFDHILVDEFQDTNHVQFEIVKHLMRAGNPNSRNHVMIIGDVKQSIYQWRSADPQIFVDIIRKLRENPADMEPPLEGMIYCALTSNFRSHPQLIDLFNVVFSKLFDDPARGACSGPVPYSPLTAMVDSGPDDGTRFHVILNSEKKVAEWVRQEARRITEVVVGIIHKDDHEILVREGQVTRHPRPGDICLLFRRNTNMHNYVKELRAHGVKCSVQTDASLFAEREISLLVDFLDWLANPDAKDSVVRILRSPIVAISDKTLRYLASKSFLLIRALKSWKPELSLPDDDKERLQDLLKLRNDLRWDREGPKSALLERIIASSCFDSVVLASDDGIQAQANLWMLIETVSSWEEAELMPYRSFVEIVKKLRQRALDGKEKDFPRAVLSDEKSRDSVRIMTVHAAKGLEFPIVIVPESIVYVQDSNRTDRVAKNRKIGMVLKPRVGRVPMPGGARIAQSTGDRSIPWAGKGDEDSLLWLSPLRNSESGMLLVSSPLNAIVSESVAEFWRILYVAATRAKDHLILSLSDGWNRYEWNSWMTFLRKVLDLGSPSKEGARDARLSWNGTDGKTCKREVAIGIEDLPALHSSSSAPKPSLVPVTGTETAYLTGCPNFIPSHINPSTFPIIAECPRRYQYEVVWRTSGLRVPPQSSGASPPSKMSAEEWGKEVHEALRLRDFSVSLGSDILLLNRLAERSNAIRSELELALRNFSELPVSQLVEQAAVKKREIIKEQTISELFQACAPPLLVEGRFDLLFRSVDGQWLLVDFKAEEQPENGSYRDRIHVAQIDGYAWLTKRALELTIAKAYIAYVHPHSSQRECTPDPRRFENTALQIVNSSDIDQANGLTARPSQTSKGPCSACPFSKKVGGPCEF
jgi:ATP-dependent helicase/nuclease subunit A